VADGRDERHLPLGGPAQHLRRGLEVLLRDPARGGQLRLVRIERQMRPGERQIIDRPYLTMNSLFYQYMTQPCRKIYNGHICQTTSIQTNLKSDCIVQILQLSNKEAICQYTSVSIDTILIEQLTEGHYIGIFPNSTKIETQCSKKEISVFT
jgi:hypothetical protein